MFNMLKYKFFFSQPKSPVNVLSFLSSLLHAYVLFDGYTEKEDSTQNDPFSFYNISSIILQQF